MLVGDDERGPRARRMRTAGRRHQLVGCISKASYIVVIQAFLVYDAVV